MASSFFLILDDIAAMADDVATMSKMAIKKTSGVLGDDLALNAQQVNGVKPNRELPVVWAVCKGSFMNKVILIPLILLLNFFLPQLIIPLLMIGGAYLCFEGAEAIIHHFFNKHSVEIHNKVHVSRIKDETVSPEALMALEKNKIKGAIKTDFILSAEILVISLSTMTGFSSISTIIAMCAIGFIFTVLVYGVVALIVKADDFGLYLHHKYDGFLDTIGVGIIKAMPYLLKTLSVVGVIAMLLVGGSIVLHGTPLYTFLADFQKTLSSLSSFGVGLAAEFIFGFIVGAIIMLVVSTIKKLKEPKELDI